MSALLIYSILLGGIALWITIVITRRLRYMKGYERAVKAYIGAGAETIYDEVHMVRSYENGTCASDAAREMISIHRNAKGG